MNAKQLILPIDKLLLDPNNYRFIDNPEYKKVPEEMLDDPRIQLRSSKFITGKNNENIMDLIHSFKTNGLLKQDPIQVRKYKDSYITIEGNRRLATLKFLFNLYKEGGETGELSENDFKKINVIEIEDQDRRHQLIAMGLNHISGKKRWNPINQAQLISDLLGNSMEEDEICESLGITKYQVRRTIRTLSLVNAYKQSDYGDQFESDKYSIFEEVIKNRALREWLEWDDSIKGARRKDREERLFSWISSWEETEDSKDEEINEWEKLKFKIHEPIITKSQEIRELAKFINDDKALYQMEKQRSVTMGYTMSNLVGETRLHNAISNITEELNTALQLSEYLTQKDYESVGNIKTKIEMILNPGNNSSLITSSSSLPAFFDVKKHYTLLNITNYRKIRNIKLDNLKPINLFVGPNNSGKTSFLEAVYLLSQFNDLNAYIDLEKYRGKFFKNLNPLWIDKNFFSEIKIQGIFDETSVGIVIKKLETEESINKNGYVTSLELTAQMKEEKKSSQLHIYQNREPIFYYSYITKLCRSAFTSPYRYNDNIIKEAHLYAVQNKKIEIILDFIRTSIDPNIQKIDLVNIHGENRFFVSTFSGDKAIDLTKYGEGLQRIFEIALLIIYCQNGITCIDEIDSAIHKDLMDKFANFIWKLAKDNNVQLFISTHNKECIDAFVKVKDIELMAYSLKKIPDGYVDYKYLEGSDLLKLLDLVNLDIR